MDARTYRALCEDLAEWMDSEYGEVTDKGEQALRDAWFMSIAAMRFARWEADRGGDWSECEPAFMVVGRKLNEITRALKERGVAGHGR